jgi:hypothetical protein
MKRASKIVAWGLMAMTVGAAYQSGPMVHADTGFPQTGQSIWGPFEKYWSEHGGLAQFGMPRTSVYPAGEGYDAQWFERALFTYNPKNPDPYKVELQLLGDTVTQGRGNEAPFRPAAKQPGATYFPVTQHNLSGKLSQYWQTTGGLPVYGYPISEPFNEVSKSDGKTYTVQYFERNRLELHPELAGTRFEVQLGLLGSEMLDKQGGPAAFAGLGKPAFYPPNVHVPGGGIVEPTVSGTPEATPSPFPTAPTLPAASGSIVYQNDFGSAGLSDWQPAALFAPPDDPVPAWRVKDGLLEQVGDAHAEGTAQDAFLVLNKPQEQVSNGRLQVYFRSVSGEGIGVLLRYSNNSYYVLRLFGTSTDATGTAQLLQVSGGSRSLLAGSTGWHGYTRNQWQLLQVDLSGPNISVSVDGAPVLSTNKAALLTGQVGLYTEATGVAKFDNFRLTAP